LRKRTKGKLNKKGVGRRRSKRNDPAATVAGYRKNRRTLKETPRKSRVVTRPKGTEGENYFTKLIMLDPKKVTG